MKLLSFFRSIGSMLHRSQNRREMDQEVRAHMQFRADDLERSGLTRSEAERRAAVEFGGVVRYQEESHEAMGGRFFETLMEDVRFGIRVLFKSPGFMAASVITLALAIGANAIVFSVLNGLVLRPLDVPGANRLYTIERGESGSPLQSYLDYVDLRDRNHSFDGVIGSNIAPVGFDSTGSAISAWSIEASGNYFDMLGVQPFLGRFFHASDEHGLNSSPYIVLGYNFWQSHFQSDPNVVGRVVQVNKHPFTVLGVSPKNFRGTELFFSPQFWVPMVDQEQIEGSSNGLTSRADRSMWMTARLKSGVQTGQALADLNSVGAQLGRMYPKEDSGSVYFLARSGLMGDMLGRPVRAFLAGLMMLSGLILLAACANLGSLFAARAADRSREIALRLALGSSRSRILRQLLTEAVMVSLVGGIVGMAGSVALLRWMSAWQPVPDFPVSLPVSPDFSVYAVALLLALLSGVVFGLVPVRQVLLSNPYGVVKAGSIGQPGRRITAREIMLVLQISVCAVLVTSSLVAVRGMMRSLHSQLGFNPDHALLVNTDLDMAAYSGDRVPEMQRRLVESMTAVPGITKVGLVDRMQLGLGWSTTYIYDDSTTDLKSSTAKAEAMVYGMAPGYLDAAGVVLLSGRDITVHDDGKAPRVAVVNREFARRILHSEQGAIGSYFKVLNGDRIRVIGLVEDGKYKTLTEDQQPAVFFPILQAPTSATWLVLRTSGDPQQVAASVATVLHGLDPGLPYSVKTWNQGLDSALFTSRVATIALGILGGLGAMLALTGIFGMASYSVSRRLRELGIRIALGAQRSEVLWAAIGRSLRLMAFGSVAGLLLGLAATRVLASIVYQATPRDPLVLAGVVLAMLLLGVAATWIPAWRALNADPLLLLRVD
jgi:predicted permease